MTMKTFFFTRRVSVSARNTLAVTSHYSTVSCVGMHAANNMAVVACRQIHLLGVELRYFIPESHSLNNVWEDIKGMTFWDAVVLQSMM